MLQSPKSGDNILAWAKNATKEINSNTIHNGIGIKVLRTPQGTNISVQPSAKSKGSSPSTRMPFDVLLGEPVMNGQQESNSRIVRIMTCGQESNILYTIGKQTKRIRPWNYDTYEKELTVPLPSLPDEEEEGGNEPEPEPQGISRRDGEGEGEDEDEEDSNVVYIVVTFNYVDSEETQSDDENDKYFPHDYDFDFIKNIDNPEDIMSDNDGFQMIPIAYIQAIKSVAQEDEEEEGGNEPKPEPQGISRRDGEGEGEDEEGPTIGGAYRTTFIQNDIEYALVQMYHGDIHLFWKGPGKLTTCSVGEVQSGEGGTFMVYLEEWDGNEEEVRVCACDLACTSYIPAGTKIIAHPIETRYIGE